MRTKSYCIDVKPIAWKRAGINYEKHKVYDQQAHDKVSFGLFLAQQHGSSALFDKPISLDVTFFMPPPKSISVKNIPLYHKGVPDLDNLCKFLLDAAVGVILKDDAIVCCLFAKKMYDKKPRTIFTITELL